jgi:two-component system, OmpR family, phosphate regulon sensor histidine kinase PhoR
MLPDWRSVWLAQLPWLLLAAAAALLVGLLFGPAWGWATACAVCVALLLNQGRHLLTLSRWLGDPESAPFPDAGGLWGEAFLRLSRHLRAQSADQQRVQDELGLFMEAIEALPDAVVMIDPNHRILWCNRATERHLGIVLARDRGGILGQRVRVPGFAEYLERTDPRAPFLLQTPPPTTRTLSIAVTTFGARGRVLVGTDITENKRVESMRSDFVANVSHEMRTPLTVVSGFLEHLREEAIADPAQHAHVIRLMSDQTDRMLSLVDDLLTLSRLESDSAPSSEALVDMGEMMARLAELGEGLSQGRQTLSFICDGPALRGNDKELRSAFANLVSNAIRYTPENGVIQVSWAVKDGKAVFMVSDSGVGIAPEHLPRLTERFYRVDRGRSRDSGGTGLGLAIVKHVLLRHQATLRIESTPGEGSCFSAEFPLWRLDPHAMPTGPQG